MNMKKTLISTAIIASTFVSAQAAANCAGNVYSMNAGRGHVGLLLDVQEAEVMGSVYTDAATRTLYSSRANFSATSMSYDRVSDRLYYANAPEPASYHVTDVENDVSADEFKNLDLQAKTLEAYQLAYFDPATDTHHDGPTIKNQILRMAFDPDSGDLFASDAKTIFKVDPITGDITNIGEFDRNLRIGGFTNWGDFVFQDGELLFVTNGRTFSINTTTGAQTMKGFHFISFVTSATLDQNGQMLIAAKNQNVSGNINSNILYRIKPSTGEKKRVGLFPSRISAMATVTSEDHTCYEKTVFPSDSKPEVSGFAANAGSVSEGSTAYFTASFDKETANATTQIRLALKNGSALLNSDYRNTVELLYSDGTTASATISSTLTAVTMPQGVTSVRIGVPTVNDSTHEDNEYFTMQAWINDDKSDLGTANVTIVDNDPDYYEVVQSIAEGSGVAWHGSQGRNPALIRGIHAYINSGYSLPPGGIRLEIIVNGSGSRWHTITSTGRFYYGDSNTELRMYDGQVAWGKLHYGGRTYNIRRGTKAQYGSNPSVICTNGC
ncbi:cadherin repeat domain-containing protein [Enterovibrio norvegicus]|uniref:cadherin repeat domain-containing protein n=1 Tax=Enterovibrio norvegicus TaxID=188144 RepID=UPI0013D4A635|nr:cadherin repeat domain-containing protein [Enterovibrio norvegicus]